VVTSVHTDLLLLALKGHAYDLLQDMPFLQPAKALTQVQPNVWPLETVDYLQASDQIKCNCVWFPRTIVSDIFVFVCLMMFNVFVYIQCWYYLGMYYSAWQQFPEASESFNLCLTIPNNGAVSQVQIEAYKKLVLVNLLSTGEVRHRQAR
jgi:hypothetical protein